MTTPRSQVSEKYEDERNRAAEQSQLLYLQSQVDDLRRLLKEQASKYNLVIEQVRRAEGGVTQVEGLFERYRQEIALTLDTYRRDIAGLRREVAGAMVKIDEGTRPIREMQSQIQQLGEARRQDRDAGSGIMVRIEDLDQRVAGWQSQLRDGDERHRALAARISELYEIDETVRSEVRKVHEDLQVEKQNMRRQVVESQQMTSDLRPLIEAQVGRLERIEGIRQTVDDFIELIPPQITAVAARIEISDGEIKRVERISTERFLMNQERVEEIRRQQDDKYRTLEDVDDVHLRQTSAWIERTDSWVRELEQRITRAQLQIEETRQLHSAHLNDLDQHDLKLADVMTTALRGYVESLRAEQVEHGRAPQE